MLGLGIADHSSPINVFRYQHEFAMASRSSQIYTYEDSVYKCCPYGFWLCAQRILSEIEAGEKCDTSFLFEFLASTSSLLVGRLKKFDHPIIQLDETASIDHLDDVPKLGNFVYCILQWDIVTVFDNSLKIKVIQ